MKALLIEKDDLEAPGVVLDVLKENTIQHDLINIFKGDQIPDPKDYAAIFVLSGPFSANDANPETNAELEKLREIVQLQIPALGICLGLQTLVKANGGEVFMNAVRERGWRDPDGNFFEIALTDKGKADPLFKGITSPFKTFQLHGETVKLTSEMELLATSKYCQNQAVRIGKNAYGIQFRFELTPTLFHEWVTKYPGLDTIDSNELNKDYEMIKEEYETTGKAILTNFLTIAGFTV